MRYRALWSKYIGIEGDLPAVANGANNWHRFVFETRLGAERDAELAHAGSAGRSRLTEVRNRPRAVFEPFSSKTFPD